MSQARHPAYRINKSGNVRLKADATSLRFVDATSLGFVDATSCGFVDATSWGLVDATRSDVGAAFRRP